MLGKCELLCSKTPAFWSFESCWESGPASQQDATFSWYCGLACHHCLRPPAPVTLQCPDLWSQPCPGCLRCTMSKPYLFFTPHSVPLHSVHHLGEEQSSITFKSASWGPPRPHSLSLSLCNHQPPVSGFFTAHAFKSFHLVLSPFLVWVQIIISCLLLCSNSLLTSLPASSPASPSCLG